MAVVMLGPVPSPGGFPALPQHHKLKPNTKNGWVWEDKIFLGCGTPLEFVNVFIDFRNKNTLTLFTFHSIIVFICLLTVTVHALVIIANKVF